MKTLEQKFTALASLVDQLAQSQAQMVAALDRQYTGETGFQLMQIRGAIKQIRDEIASLQAD